MLQLSALRQGQAVCGLPNVGTALRGLRARLRLCRFRRRPGRIRHVSGRLYRCRRRLGDGGGRCITRRIGSTRRFGCPSSSLSRWAVAADEGIEDCAAALSQGRRERRFGGGAPGARPARRVDRARFAHPLPARVLFSSGSAPHWFTLDDGPVVHRRPAGDRRPVTCAFGFWEERGVADDAPSRQGISPSV